MADVPVTVQVVDRTGITPVYTGSLATDNVYVVPNDGKVWLHIKKAGAGAVVVTAETPGSVDGLAVADKTNSVIATTGDEKWGPFPTRIYGRELRISFSEITGLSFGAFRLDND